MEFQEVMKRLLGFMTGLYHNYGWWALAIIGATTLIMIPINMLIKLCFKKGEENVALVRLRKALSSVSAYGVAIGSLYLYEWLVPEALMRTPKTFSFLVLVEDVLSTGTAAMIVWWVLKLVRDIGIKPIVLKIAESTEGKKLLNELAKKAGIKKSIVESIVEEVETVLKDCVADGSTTVEEYIAQHQDVLNQQAMHFVGLCDKIEEIDVVAFAKSIAEIVTARNKK